MTKPRILIVEDDTDLSEMLESYFKTLDYDVLTAAWGAEGLQIAKEHALDIVMLDIRLPDINGYDVCRQLRTQRRTQDVPILFLTEKRDRVDKLQGLELGVVDYITKPFDINELRLRVRNALSRAQQQIFTHRVTELPDGALVNERLSMLLYSTAPWAAIAFSVEGLDLFREHYGFVAADDVLRAITLMMRNAVREFGSEEDFIGHLNAHQFVVITDTAHAESIRERVLTKMALSREFFYPLQDRETPEGELKLAESEMLSMRAAVFNQASGDFDDGSAMKDEMLRALNTSP